MNDREEFALKVSAWGAMTFVILAGWFISPNTTHRIYFRPERTHGDEDARKKEAGRWVAVDLISRMQDLEKPLVKVANSRARTLLGFGVGAIVIWWLVTAFVVWSPWFPGGKKKKLKPSFQLCLTFFVVLVSVCHIVLLLTIADYFEFFG